MCPYEQSDLCRWQAGFDTLATLSQAQDLTSVQAQMPHSEAKGMTLLHGSLCAAIMQLQGHEHVRTLHLPKRG